MPKGLYFTAVIFSFFFFLISVLFFFLSSFFFFSTPNIWGHWTDLNQTLTHIHLWLLFEKFGPNSPGHLPPRAEGKTAFLGTTLNFDGTCLCNGTINNRKETCQSTENPLHAPNLVNFGPETTENGRRVYAHPVNFCIERHCQPYRMDVI